ncbi:hypothetical protein FX985_01481 [Pseudomonas extremaustralis]|uniref:DUF4393 domain-containing protein n=1 Tax=Pseudomonas extremaustralis TaxID=359110 RepID=A0A5M9IZU8_9PSED|nr:Abi-alpha family protein [Pseudomonas extremaustralis]KAA8561429.1 hypothetical protein FX985_01481 [Pseudomonas extremaustralis]
MDVPKIEIKLDATKVVEDVYEDGVADVLKEVSTIGVDAVKTLKLALFPLQLGAFFQDRLTRYFSEALHRVPLEHRVAPIESTVLQISEKLRVQEEGGIITEMYVALLECAFDKRRFGQAHPSFVNIVTQLSADEAILLDHISTANAKIYFGREPIDWAQTSSSIERHFSEVMFKSVKLDWQFFINPDVLAEPSYLQIYIEHLVSMGLVSYDNDRPTELAQAFESINGQLQPAWAIRLSRFGKLFHQACTGEAILRATASDRL